VIQTGLLNKSGDHNRKDPYERKSVYILKWNISIKDFKINTLLVLSAIRYSSHAYEISFWGSKGKAFEFLTLYS
jgi:hypothetical protein